MSIFVEAKMAASQALSMSGRMDPVLVPASATSDDRRQLPNPAVALRRLQRRLGLRFDARVQDLGLPPEMSTLIPDDATPLATVTSLLMSSKIFDADFYLAQVPEGHRGREAPIVHFVTKGWRTGLSPNFYFDPSFYVLQLPAEETADINPLWHYLYIGEAAGLRPCRHFDPVWYRTKYALLGQSALCHFLRHIGERTNSPNPDFDVEYYLRTYPDVRKNGGDPLRHYVLFGQREGRHPYAQGTGVALSHVVVTLAPLPETEAKPIAHDDDRDVQLILDSHLFDVVWYRRQAGRMDPDPGALVRHYLGNATGARIGPNPLFDVDFYLQRHGDCVADADPLIHYIREGWHRHFDPHPLFSVRFYLEENGDVREAGYEPLAHYLESGAREGRSPCEEFDSSYYLEQNSDVASQGCDPLRHYLDYGAAEGRNPSPTFDTSWYGRHILKDKAVNPLAHFRSSGASAGDVFVRKICLSKNFEMSDRDFRRWVQTFADAGGEVSSSSTAVELVRVHSGPTDATAEPSAGAARNSTVHDALVECRQPAPDPGSDALYLFCDPADEIDERLLPRLTDRVMATGGLGIFDFVARHGALWAPILLPGANVAHLEAVDATFSRFAISGRLLSDIAMPEDSAAYDILRAALAHLRAEGRLDRFTHTPVPVLRTGDLSDAIKATRLELAQTTQTAKPQRPSRGAPSSVSVVICTKDRCRLLSQLVDSLLDLSTSIVREIVIVANPDADSFADRVHRHYATKKRVTLLRHEGPYNFSHQSNRGAAACSGDLLLFLNDDIVPVAPHWLETLRAPFANPAVGITAPLLLYPDEKSQHAGMYLGFNEIAGHTMRGARLPDEDYMFVASARRNVSAVTGAALLTARPLFEDLNGFDRQLGTYLQDVDYCLRARNLDREIVYEPASLLFHMESVSMRETLDEPVFADRRPLEHRHFMRKWGAVFDCDEFHNPNFDVGDESLRTIARRA